MIVDPSFDAGRLAGLVEELGGDRAAAAQFADQYVQMLPQRIAALSAALQGGDRTRIGDALQGLRAPAEMVGARGLARVADRWEYQVHLAPVLHSDLTPPDVVRLKRRR